MSKQYVQHVSGQGEKWEVTQDMTKYWQVDGSRDYRGYYYYLPKSEYLLCEPPEVWRDISEQCITLEPPSQSCGQFIEDQHYVIARVEKGYRLRKVQSYGAAPNEWAFIVEKKVYE